MDDYLSADTSFLPQGKSRQERPVQPLCCHDNLSALVCGGRQRNVILREVVRKHR